MKNNYILVHGSFGIPFVNWFRYLRKEIENRKLEVYIFDFATGIGYQMLLFLIKIILSFYLSHNAYR